MVDRFSVLGDSAARARVATVVRSGLGEFLPAGVTVSASRSEDFGSFQQQVHGVFFFLGVSNTARGWNRFPHAPDYVADERSNQRRRADDRGGDDRTTSGEVGLIHSPTKTNS